MSPRKDSQPLRWEEVDEHEPVEEGLDEQPLGVPLLLAVAETGHALLRVLEYLLVPGEESLGDGLDVEGLVQGGADAAPGLKAPVDVGELLNGGAARDVPLDDDAAQGWPRAGESGVYEVQLVAEALVKSRSRSPPSCPSISLAAAAASPLRTRSVSSAAYRTWTPSSWATRSAGVGQGRVARGAGQVRLAEVRVEVQHLDEQGADGGSPLERRRGEDARDALLDLGRVVTVLDGHAPFLSKSGLPQV